jgi:membrane protease YdiL (CAAX protease family)
MVGPQSMYGFWGSTKWSVAAIALCVVAAVATLALCSLMFDQLEDEAQIQLGAAVGCLTLTGAIIWAVQRTSTPVSTYLGFIRTSARYFALAVGVEVVLTIVQWLVSFLCGGSIDLQREELRNALQAGALPIFLLTSVLLAPLAEETLFRGFLLPSWSKSRLGPIGGVVAISALFALPYIFFDVCGVGTIALASLFWGWLRLRSGSLLPSLLARCLGNAYAMSVAAWGLT